MICFVLKLSSAYSVCCIYLNDSKTTLNMEATNMNTMNLKSSLIWVHILAINATKAHQQIRKQTTRLFWEMGLKLDCTHCPLQQTVHAKMTCPTREYFFWVHGKHKFLTIVTTCTHSVYTQIYLGSCKSCSEYSRGAYFIVFVLSCMASYTCISKI